ncbi:MAG: phasin family protein [Alphaproteobacteria bacterium]|jgi:ElaB/YqjD/DUF883 family membrane-anchored ribosome-binding protein
MANYNDIFSFGKNFQEQFQNNYQSWQDNVQGFFSQAQNSSKNNAFQQKAQEFLKQNVATAQEAMEVVVENSQNNFNQIAKTLQANADEGLNAFKEIVASKNPREAAAIVSRTFQQSSEKLANDVSSIGAKVAQANNQVLESLSKQASQSANDFSQLISEFFKQAQSSFSNLQNGYSAASNGASSAAKKAESSAKKSN